MIRHSTRKKTNEEFVKELKQTTLPIIPLENYKNNRTKIKCKCLIHNTIQEAAPKKLLLGHNPCKECLIEKRQKLRHDNEWLLNLLKEKQIYDVIPLEDYKGRDKPMKFRCKCGDEWITTPDRVLLGNHCKKCGYESFTGEKSPNWKFELTPEDRHDRVHRFRNTEYTKFIKNVLERDNYTCQITGIEASRSIRNHNGVVVHHINGYGWDIENRTNIDNGITLSTEIHKEFHKTYGNGNNTKQQFIEFLQKLYSENRISEEKYNSLLERLNKIK